MSRLQPSRARGRIKPALPAAAVFLVLASGLSRGVAQEALQPRAPRKLVELVGGLIFFDEALSINGNQSCAACHASSVGWTGPDQDSNRAGSVYEGSVAGRFGGRKPPSSAYFSLGPTLYLDPERGFVGGAFWDGRATGFELDDPAAEQAMGPFLNPVEQALPDASAVVGRVCSGSYGWVFRRTWGSAICADTDRAFTAIAQSIAQFERSDRVNSFSSKFDAVIAGRACFTERERLGRDLFEGKAHCADCHANAGLGRGELFTDFTYDNIGTPRNPGNPFYDMDDVLVDGQPINPAGERWIDSGLGGSLETLANSNDWRTAPHVSPSIAELDSAQLRALAESNLGKHKVPTLRNVSKSPAPD